MTNQFEHNSIEWKNQVLADAALKHGEKVRFRMENHSCWGGPTSGILHTIPNLEPYIEATDGDHVFNIAINEYLSAYIGTIEKVEEND